MAVDNETADSSIITNTLPYLLMILTVLFWGVSWPVGGIVASEFGRNVFTAAFIRFTIAIPFLLVFTKVIEGNISVPKEFHKNIAILGLMQITIYNFMYLSGLRFTSASDASLIIAINPTLTAIFASIVYQDERLNPKRIIGIILAFTGVFLIFIDSPNTQVANRLLGNFLIFLGALVWSLYTTFSRPIYQKVSPLKFQVWATIYGWLALGMISIIEKPWTQDYTIRGIGALVYLGIFAAALANTFFSYGIKKIGPTQTSVFVNLVPLIGVLSSVLIVGDQFSYIYLVSFVLIILGVRTVNKS